MNKRFVFMAGGLAALGITLIALPGRSSSAQAQQDASSAQAEQECSAALEKKLAQVQERLQGASSQFARVEEHSHLARQRALQASQRAFSQYEDALQKVEALPEQDMDQLAVLVGDEGPSWLGIETHEVTADSAKELKLSAERGVVVGRVTPDSPAAKAGLKEKDVITEVNGQRVEGAAQFRRMIHEIPAGRTAQLGIWRDGHAQTLSVTLGKAEENHRTFLRTGPDSFSFTMPKVEIPEMPSFDFGGEIGVFAGGRARIGIDAEDLDGQLGAYFGAPDGEGILVRSVNPGSPAEKAGVKAGDVITSINGERIRTVGDLREKLAAKPDEKQAKLGVLRNKSEMTLTVDLPERSAKVRRKTVTRRTYI
jgi:serine protease Do